jgi:hypothetical protein
MFKAHLEWHCNFDAIMYLECPDQEWFLRTLIADYAECVLEDSR